MNQNTKPTKSDNQKFDTQIDDFKKLWSERGEADLKHLDDIPNFDGEDEPIPFPYGSKKGKDFGQWIDPQQKKYLMNG